MSRAVDEKIVKMKMDNSDLKSKVTDTIGMFSKLQSTISGLKPVNVNSTVTGLSDVASSVSSIESRFSALGVVAMTVLQNITNKAMAMGDSLIKAAMIEPLSSGFQEYELKMGSIQTILANTSRYGTTLDEVTASLDELNEYADKTIYNFGDMTRNIGLFTNSGLRVEEATSMIKGFSNAAAASGTNAQGAASAAYQLSQALSSGTVRLMDWRSLTTVGMGSKNMQDGLIDIARAMGTLNETGTTAEEIQNDFNSSSDAVTSSNPVPYLDVFAKIVWIEPILSSYSWKPEDRGSTIAAFIRLSPIAIALFVMFCNTVIATIPSAENLDSIVDTLEATSDNPVTVELTFTGFNPENADCSLLNIPIVSDTLFFRSLLSIFILTIFSSTALLIQTSPSRFDHQRSRTRL